MKSLGRKSHSICALYATENDAINKQLILKNQRILLAEMKVLLSEPPLVNNDVTMAS